MVYRSQPLGIWQEVAEVGPYMLDPALFLDDDGKVYLYYYGAPNGPIYGVELDPINGFQTVGKPFACLYGDYENRGWECRGDENLGVRRRNKRFFRVMGRYIWRS